MSFTIRRFDKDFARREFLKLGVGFAGAGILSPLWAAMERHGEFAKAYPDELLSIDSYTKGKLKAGDYIDAGNVDFVKELLEPVKYHQVKTMGRRFKLRESTQDVMRLSPYEYMEASFRNRGKARFSDGGNVVTADGKPWIGGLPFPTATKGVEFFAGLTMSWGRHDASFYPIREYDLNHEGKVAYEYELGWAEYAPVGRVVMPDVYWKGHEDKLRYQSVFFTAPNSVRGTSFLNIWHYDQRKFPELFGYIPDFKRIRRYPSDQRFEPLVPGSNLYLSDAWGAGDPLHTWGNYKIAWRGPLLGAISGAWGGSKNNWQHSVHGGPQGQTFWDTELELVPEAIAVDAEPVGFPRAPVGRKRVWFDARTQLPLGMVTYDRRGELFRSFDGAYGLYENDNERVMDGKHTYWSWGHAQAFDVQTGKMTRIEQLASIGSGYKMQVNTQDIYNRYLTNAALRSLGS